MAIEPLYVENEDTTGSLFEILGGWAAQTRWQRTGGHGFPVKKPLTPEDVISKWDIFTNFGKWCTQQHKTCSYVDRDNLQMTAERRTLRRHKRRTFTWLETSVTKVMTSRRSCRLQVIQWGWDLRPYVIHVNSHGICMNQYLLPIIKYENIQAKNHDVLALAVHWHVIDA